MRVRRLTRQADLDRVRTEGQAHGTAAFVAVAVRAAGGPARIGVVAGKRIGGAVQRNRAKRLLREGIRPLYPSIAPGWDVLLMARRAILGATSTQVAGQLERALLKLKVVEQAGSQELSTDDG
jgi:ribonuclease P protein component